MDGETLAKAAVGQLAMHMVDDSFGEVGQEQALEMASAMGAAPHIAAGFAVGQDWTGADDGSLDGAALRDNVMDMYYGSAFTMMQKEIEAESEAEAAEAERVRRDAVYGYSGMTADDIARAEFDAENGDDSLLLRAEERFYLG